MSNTIPMHQSTLPALQPASQQLQPPALIKIEDCSNTSSSSSSAGSMTTMSNHHHITPAHNIFDPIKTNAMQTSTITTAVQTLSDMTSADLSLPAPAHQLYYHHSDGNLIQIGPPPPSIPQQPHHHHHQQQQQQHSLPLPPLAHCGSANNILNGHTTSSLLPAHITIPASPIVRCITPLDEEHQQLEPENLETTCSEAPDGKAIVFFFFFHLNRIDVNEITTFVFFGMEFIYYSSKTRIWNRPSHSTAGFFLRPRAS